MGSFHVDSEVGRLRRAIVHRPGLELKRLTPSNKDDLLFDGVAINAMRKDARMLESLHYEAIYRWHPMFADADFPKWSEGTTGGKATMEGGDVLVIGNGAVLVGMSERTTPQAVE